MNPPLPFSEEHQQKKKAIMQTGIWITEEALNRVYSPLNNHLTLLCYKMFDILRNKTALQPTVCDVMLKSQKQLNFYGLTNHQVTEQEEKRSKHFLPLFCYSLPKEST